MRTTPFDPAEQLDTLEARQAFLNDALNDGTAELGAEAFTIMARACGRRLNGPLSLIDALDILRTCGLEMRVQAKR